MEIILNGKTIKNATVMNNVDSKNIPFTIVTARGKTFSLVRNRKTPTLLGVVNHGAGLGNHKFRGWSWMREENNTLVGVS
tara:strand:+ start:79 stop:318 length:240 start_codon:yes stop_codon:yes gene_type:complete